ncbi:MAG: hypothetical protein R3C71_02145 [Candidatus Krumholzibacteriia bacterium]|nr:hypothetical protein [Candidatus Latescibacterota bacterium]MCB9515293.1 hypothetical protein [Candidatus Latescibacterota bacterium]
MIRPGLLAATLVTLAASSTPVRAVETQYYRYARMEDYQDASFRELILADDGSWRLGPRFEELLADEVAYFSELGDDGRSLLLAGGGSPGKLILFDKGKQRHAPVLTADDLLFSCVETLGTGDWAVGSGPGGVVFRVKDGEAKPFVETGEDFVWDLLRQGDTLYIATGSRGTILRHDLKRGTTETFATLPDQSAFCLAMDDQGRLLAGSSGEGLLYRFDRDGNMTQLADFDAEEVQAILPEPGGGVVVAVAQSEADCKENCSAVYRLEAGGVLEKLLGSDSAFIGDLLPAPGGAIWVASGKPGELDRLTGPYHGEVYASEPERYYSDLALDSGGEDLWLLQSKPARLLKISGRAERGTLTSEVLDLNNRSLGGALRLEGDLPRGCGFAVEARCGHNAEPGDPGAGWTDWTACPADGDSYRMALPAARYFQWRVVFEGAGDRSPRLYRVTASFLPLNRSPLLGNLTVLRPTDGPFAESMELGGRPFTQVMERGVRVQYQQKAGPELAMDPDVPSLRGLRELHWDWLDPDGDRLRATLELQREGEDDWQLLARDYENSTYTWDTRGLPDGRYRLRVTADDGLDNDAARAKTSTLVSERVQLDAQPPSCALRVERAKDGLRLRGTVADAGGLLTRLEYRLDDGPWLRVTGPDGLMDRSRLDLDVDLGDTAGASRLELRAGDEFGNWGYFRSSLETAR